MTSTTSSVTYNYQNNKKYVTLFLDLGSYQNKYSLSLSLNQTNDDAVTFAKRKHHFTDSKSETELMVLLQDIRKEVGLKHTGIK